MKKFQISFDLSHVALLLDFGWDRDNKVYYVNILCFMITYYKNGILPWNNAKMFNWEL